MAQQSAIPGSDADLQAALADVNLPNLLVVLACITGSDDWIADKYQPAPMVAPEGSLFPDDSGGYGDALQTEIRTAAFDVLKAVRDGSQTVAPTPNLERFHRLMTFSVGEPVEESYSAMLLEEVGFVDRDATWQAPLAKAVNAGKLKDFNVIVIGGGMSGIGIASKLTAAGVPYTLLEKNDAVGGTWYENSYPDCGVDTPNHFYSYSFDRNPNWSGYFSKRDELHQYFERCATEHNVRDNVQFNTEVISSVYNKQTHGWEVRTRVTNADGSTTEQQLTANVVVSAVGQLNRPMMPEIDGLDDFAGPMFHSARWQSEHDLTGKRVAVVGTGCSAVQLLPKTAAKAAQVDVYQRSPHWIAPSRDYYRAVEDGLKWALNHVPYYAEWHRARMIWGFADRSWPAVNADPSWPHLDRSMNEMSDGMREALTGYIKEELGTKAHLAPKCTPDFPVWGKRLIVDNNWYQNLARDNVDLITEGINKVTATGLETADGQHHEADVLIVATGFRSNLFLWPMDVRGKSGKSLAETWGDYPRAYQGITVPDFPNLFCLYGPNTNIVHGGSIIYQVECQIHYVMQCINAMFTQGIEALEVREEVNDEYNEEVQNISAQLAWGHEGVQSWYKNSQGHVVNNSPFSLHRYWEVTHALDLEDYHLEYPS